jgi:hypothetical protein
MLKYLNQLPNDYVDQLNTGLMNKEYDRDLIELLVDSFKGLEILPNIKILGYTWEPEEDKYDVNDHVVRRNVNKNKAIKNITETRCGVLYIDIEISGPDKTGKHKVHYIKKPIIVPIQDERGYYRIKGKDYFLIYQMVDKMMYPSIGAVTIKSLMPICVKTVKEDISDVNENTYTIPIYNIQIFKSAINILLLYSNLTITKSLNFMEVNRFIKILQKDDYTPNHETSLYFECGKKSDIVVSVLKDPFEKFIYVKSIVGCLIKLFEETKIPFKDIDNWEEWMIIVGGKNTIRRGMYQHVFFNRLLDDVTRKELKINDYDKQNIYYLLRWIVQNYHVLWEKDNLSMVNKRLRCNEYVGSLMTAEISKRINRLVSLGDKATIKEYLAAFKFPEDIFVSKMYGSGILRYNETNNDMDFHSKWKITKKGPNSLGNSNQKRIPVRQRLLHPSMLGYIDIASTSSSEPGQGGDLSPWNDMNSLYFDSSLAENEMHYKIKQYLDENPLDDEWEELIIKCDNMEQYNSILDSLLHYSDGKIRIYATTNNDTEIIVMEDPRNNYRKFDEKNLTGNSNTDNNDTK